MFTNMPQIPIVDFANPDVNRETIAHDLDSAFSTVGFVYLKNHGINYKLIEAVLESSVNFFKQPEELKEISPFNIRTFSGYTGKDQEILEGNSSHEIREAYDVCSPDSAYPDESVPELRKALCNLATELRKINHSLLECMATGLGLDINFFTEKHRYVFEGENKNGTILRTLYYPSIENVDVQPGTVRCGEHSDYGTVTLLIQDDMGGLELLSGNDWIPANPISGTLLVNLGDLMQFWTSDRYKATVHRVRVPEEELRRKKPRQSIAFFVQPDNGVLVAPLDGSRNKHPPVESLAYLRKRLSETYKY